VGIEEGVVGFPILIVVIATGIYTGDKLCPLNASLSHFKAI